VKQQCNRAGKFWFISRNHFASQQQCSKQPLHAPVVAYNKRETRVSIIGTTDSDSSQRDRRNACRRGTFAIEHSTQ
jgi:hypothetical protein